MIKLFEFCREYGLEIHMRYSPKYDLVYCNFYNPRTKFTYVRYIKGETLKYFKDPKDIEEFENHLLDDAKLRMFINSEVMPDDMDR